MGSLQGFFDGFDDARQNAPFDPLASFWFSCGGEATMLRNPCRRPWPIILVTAKVEAQPIAILGRCFHLIFLFYRHAATADGYGTLIYPF